MKILIGCEHSQTLTELFTLQGHSVTSCDFYDGDKGYDHYKGNVLDIINDGWDMAVFFPPCTFLAKSQIHLLANDPERQKKSEEALQFVKELFFSKIPLVAVENPIGLISQKWRQPDQIISPHQFGDPYVKDICLWLRGLPQIVPGLSQARPTIEGFPEDLPGTIDRRAWDKPGTKMKTVTNHVNSRMTKEEKSKIKSSWKWFPNMSKQITEQWGKL